MWIWCRSRLCTLAGRNRFTDWLWQMKGARSAACSTTQRWSNSKAVLNTALSCSLRKSRCCTEPLRTVMLVQVSSSSRPCFASTLAREGLRTMKLPDSVLWLYTFAAIGSIPGLAPPQMIEMLAVGAIAILFENRSITP